MKKYRKKIKEFTENFNDFAEEHIVIGVFCVSTIFVFLFMVTIFMLLWLANILYLIIGVYSLFIVVPVVIGLVASFVVWTNTK